MTDPLCEIAIDRSDPAALSWSHEHCCGGKHAISGAPAQPIVELPIGARVGGQFLITPRGAFLWRATAAVPSEKRMSLMVVPGPSSTPDEGVNGTLNLTRVSPLPAT